MPWRESETIVIGVGIAVGWGGHTYVQENIDGWMGRAIAEAPPPRGSPHADGGVQDDSND